MINTVEEYWGFYLFVLFMSLFVMIIADAYYPVSIKNKFRLGGGNKKFLNLELTTAVVPMLLFHLLTLLFIFWVVQEIVLRQEINLKQYESLKDMANSSCRVSNRIKVDIDWLERKQSKISRRKYINYLLMCKENARYYSYFDTTYYYAVNGMPEK